ncbi:leucyl aminopeptidase [Amycolatopsis cihanbeyliensis]|uniref:Probable cytosol aminopeptidase n=1 Tax=Amycolatopsis cihanbeyliensis TaxID=1128664 RepID=A0A542DGG8_AMYCI|nr:leucyl aminopeptidase [Amycolatopsis cihanbeyliensis]TQJ02166.1 leucyl aminopeptidase [Amycolatopsis cihanbeyliensis]
MTVPKLALSQHTEEALVKSKAEVVVVGTVQGTEGAEPARGAGAVDAALGGTLLDALRALGATGKAEEVVKLPTMGALASAVVLAVGLGKPDAAGELTPEQVRRASGAAARALAGTGRALTTLSVLDLQAAVEGTALGAYAFTRYKSEPGDAPVSAVDVAAPAEGTTREHRATLKAATAIAESVIVARDLINTPPNDLYPASFADRARKLAESAGLEFEVLDEKALRRKGFGGILGVGSGSSRPPRLLKLTHRPARAKTKVALVGKGITFDTGGISIKPAANMEHMTSDMSGAAAVLAAVLLAAKLKYPVEVVAHIPLAENMPSGTAYRPGDVLTMYGGKTVEVLNTDAEGRLVLADAIVRAAEDDPDYLIETSTLTGAQLVALGNRTAGIMGSDEFRDRVAGIAAGTGEGGWAMPLPEELRADLDSRLADLANTTGQRWAGMLAAGVFLREFVAAELPWVHIDIAGPSFNTSAPWGYTGKGGTGVPVRTIAAVLADIADNG